MTDVPARSQPDGPDRAVRRPALSPSRAADFKQCPLLYRFRAIDRLPEPPSPAQVRGSVVHAALERLYALPADERHRETALTCAESAGWELGEAVVDAGWDEFDFLSVLAMHPHEYGPEPTKAEFQLLFEEATQAWMYGAERPYQETFAAFAERVRDAMRRTVELAGSGTVAVFTSGGPIGLAVAEILADPGDVPAQLPGLWGRLNRMAVNAALTRLITGSRGINLLTYNDQSHLDGTAGAVTYR